MLEQSGSSHWSLVQRRSGLSPDLPEEECETTPPAALNTRLKELHAAGFVHKGEGGYVATDLGRRLYQQLCPLGGFGKE